MSDNKRNASESIFTKLSSPFAIYEVKWRVGATSGNKGLALAYVDARVVMERLDFVMGPENWQSTHSCADGKTLCRIGIKFRDEWVWKSDGAGDTNIEAEKGAISDAFKRAAVHWGVGRYLYTLGSTWVELSGNKIANNEYKKLSQILKDQNQNYFKPKIIGTNNTAIGDTTGVNNTAVGNGAFSYTKYDKEGKAVSTYTNFKSYADNLEIKKFSPSQPWRDATHSELQNIKEWVEANNPDHLQKIDIALTKIQEEIRKAANDNI